MDHQTALRRLRSPKLLQTALTYAVFDRTGSDWFYDPVEIEHAVSHSEELIDELIEELREPARYAPRTAFAFFPPKNHLCDRRMVYLPIKDLVVRYAFGILFADEIDTEIHPQCFANRRAIEDEAKLRFTQDFATGGWANFCAWQHDASESHTVLLRTDISAFYDSVSHGYLVQAVCRHLSLPADCELIRLLRKLLQVKVIYYSPANSHIEGPAVMHQGLPIGDGIEGFLANIFLKDLDDAMTAEKASYGRYVDDIRLFGTSRRVVHHRLRIVQEQLLRKGLNLNSSKTRIAENREQLRELVSKNHGLAEYGDLEPLQAGLNIHAQIDQPFEAFSRTFTEIQPLDNGDDARDFCKYLSANDRNGDPVVPIAERQVWHVRTLKEVILRWRGPCKHATWLLVQTATYHGVSAKVQRSALKTMLEMLDSEEADAYSRYRMLHHLLKLRKSKRSPTFRFFHNLPHDARRRILASLPSLLRAPAFELNLIGLYLAKVTGSSASEMKLLVKKHGAPKCEHLRKALALLAEKNPDAVIVGPREQEPDEWPAQY
jgi:hypothetical protein